VKSPLQSHSIGRQGCEGIIRIGQDFERIIISYYVHRTYNAMQMTKVVKNALSGVAAVMCSADTMGDHDYVATRVSCKKLARLHEWREKRKLPEDENIQALKESVDFSLEIQQKLGPLVKWIHIICSPGEVRSNTMALMLPVSLKLVSS
jgi:hypothetical protein